MIWMMMTVIVIIKEPVLSVVGWLGLNRVSTFETLFARTHHGPVPHLLPGDSQQADLVNTQRGRASWQYRFDCKDPKHADLCMRVYESPNLLR